MRVRGAFYLSVAVLLLGAALAAQADMPQLMNYQGVLLDSGGDPVTTPTDVLFTIYDGELSTNDVWSEEQTVSPDALGRFSVKLGLASGLTEAVFDAADRWLEVQIVGEPTPMAPRVQIVSVAYAFVAAVADSADAITDGGVDFADIGQNDATEDQVIKWKSGEWVASEDEIGHPPDPCGWLDDGTSVRLETATDNVGIGTSSPRGPLHIDRNIDINDGSNFADRVAPLVVDDEDPGGECILIDDDQIEQAGTDQTLYINYNSPGNVSLAQGGGNVGVGLISPSEKLEVDGNLRVTGKANIGPGNVNPGDQAFVAGQDNSADGNFSTIGGGSNNDVDGNYSTVGGGQQNTIGGYYNTIGGGNENRTSGLGSTVAGGQENRAGGDYSFTVGYRDTIGGTGDYSILFGIDSKLDEDSTFMVDMPHIRFGNATDGYEFPTVDGGVSQVLATDGSGQVGWESVSNTTDADWAFSGDDLYSGVDGNVGVGTTTPAAKLEVSSLMRLTPTDDPGGCGETLTGSIYYDLSRNEFCYCDGSGWMQLDGGGSCEDNCPDVDGDGYDICDPGNPYDTDGLDADCDDGDEFINPGESELCDGIDNDCDGADDNGYDVGDPCSVGYGPCEGHGFMVCTPDGLGTECDAVPGDPEPEICNEVDDDCDGEIDEGAPCEGDLIITEINPNPSYTGGDYFEIYNAAEQTINLNGLRVSQDDGEQFFTVNQNINVSPGSYFAFADLRAMFGYDYGFSDEEFTIDNADDLKLTHGGMVIDQVSWTTSWPFSSGYSMVLDDSAFDATSNDNSSNWCTSTSMFESSDYGTPGAANDDCF